MKKNGFFYYKIDVISRSHGYSFMVRSAEEISDEDEIIERANNAGCFEDEEDLDKALVDSLIDDSDIKAFKDATTDI